MSPAGESGVDWKSRAPLGETGVEKACSNLSARLAAVRWLPAGGVLLALMAAACLASVAACAFAMSAASPVDWQTLVMSALNESFLSIATPDRWEREEGEKEEEEAVPCLEALWSARESGERSREPNPKQPMAATLWLCGLLGEASKDLW